MIKQWALKALLIVLFPIGIYIWFSNRKLAEKNAALEAQEKAVYKRNAEREAAQTVIQQTHDAHIESLQEEAKIRADTASRPQVINQMQALKSRAAKRGKKRFGGRG